MNGDRITFSDEFLASLMPLSCAHMEFTFLRLGMLEFESLDDIANALHSDIGLL